MSLPNPPGQIILNLKDTYGAMFVGCQLSMALLAIQYYQTMYYFKKYSNIDPWYEQLAILGAAMLSTAHQVVNLKPLWVTLIQNFGSLTAVTHLQPDLIYQIIFTGIMAFGVQLFFLRRIFRFAENIYFKWGAMLSILPFTTYQLIGSILYTARGLRMDAMLEVLTMVDLAISFNAATVVADLGILVCMFYLLQTRRQRIASRQTRKILETLMVTTVNSGAWSTLFAIMTLIMLATIPDKFWLVGVGHMPLCGLYCNSLLGNLNARKIATNNQESSVHTLQMGPLRYGSSSHDNHTLTPAEISINVEQKIMVA